MLPATLVRTGLRDLVRRPLHTGLMVLGVALGVAVVVAIDLANGAARRAFARSTEAIVGRATHQILGGPGGLEQDVLRRVRLEAGVRASAPIVEGVAVALDLGREPLRVLGVDPLSEGAFRDHVGGGRIGDAAFAPFFTDPKAVLLSATFARRHGLDLGSTLRIRAGDRVEELRVLGVVEAQDGASASALDGLMLLDVGAAQRLLRLEDRLSRIDLILASAEEREAVTQPPASRRPPRSRERAERQPWASSRPPSS